MDVCYIGDHLVLKKNEVSTQYGSWGDHCLCSCHVCKGLEIPLIQPFLGLGKRLASFVFFIFFYFFCFFFFGRLLS
jgi:hypothetical protein